MTLARKLSAFSLAGTFLIASQAFAVVTQLGSYGLGEAGTVTGGAPFVPLVDSVGVANNISNFQAGGGVGTVISSGLAAPGSTAALQISNNAGGSSGWFGGANYGLTNNWAIDFWIRPDNNAGTYGGATDNNIADAPVFHLTNNGVLGRPTLALRQTRDSANFIDGGQYNTGQWYRLTAINDGGIMNYFVDGVLKGTANWGDRSLNSPMFGFGPQGTAGTNAAFDQLKVYAFEGSDSLSAVVETVFGSPMPITPTVNFDLGNGGLYTGSGPAAPSVVSTWTSAPGPGEGPFVDPGTGIGLRVFNGSQYINSNPAGNSEFDLFNDFVVDTTGTAAGIQTANWELTGLNDSLLYDLYFIAPNGQQFGATNVYGAVYEAQGLSAAASGATNLFNGWQAGVNYAVLSGLRSTGGIISGFYNENPNDLSPGNFGLAGLQVVIHPIPEPATATLGLLGVAGLMMRRRRMA